MGEFGLIARLAGLVAATDAHRAGTEAGWIGIGDDAAAWPQPRGIALATTDALVEGIHFDLALTGWWDLGWKALAVNLSDIAAMGGRPRHALVTLGLRPSTAVTDVEALYAGMLALAAAEDVRIAGGDTVVVRHEQFLNVAVWGTARQARGVPVVLTRRGAQTGDLVAATGQLGASAAGLYVLQHGQGRADGRHDALVAAHLRPRPRLEAGRQLVRAGVRVAIDVSDGLLADLGRVCQASGRAAVVWASALPIPEVVRASFPDRSLAWAATGGEDYELLFVAAPSVMALAEAAVRRAGVPTTVVGEIVDGRAGEVRLVDERGQEIGVPSTGWDHFAYGRGEPLSERPSR